MPSPGTGGGPAAGARKKLTPKAPAGAVPVFRAVKDTVSGRPAPIVAGADTAAISRSGRKGTTSSGSAAVKKLLAPFVPSSASPASGTARPSSATADRKYVAGGRSGGIIALVRAVELAPTPRLVTLRVAMRWPEPGVSTLER